MKGSSKQTKTDKTKKAIISRKKKVQSWDQKN